MKTNDAILDHVKYGLAHVDGLCWLCERLIAGVPPGDLTIRVGDQVLLRRPTFGALQNALAESGLIYCRKLLDFLGLKSQRNGGTLIERTESYSDDTVGIEDLHLPRVSLAALDSSPFGSGQSVRAACEHTLRAANKGVAHFTEDRGERADAEQILRCGQVVGWLAEKHVYKALDVATPVYKVWTAG
jgi:hypothetical protein